MDDKPGMINQITEILKSKNINIHIQESLITNDEQNFSVSLIVDTKDFIRRISKNGGSEKLMEDELSTDFAAIGIHMEKFLPCKQLRNNSTDVQSNKKTNAVDNDTLNNFYTINYHPIQIIKKELVIGKQVIQALFQDIDGNADLQGTIFSDTNEKMVIVRFFNIDQHVVYFDVQHENKLGALFHYSSLIKETSSSYNIISCYNRVENATKTAHWYVLLDVSHDIDKLHTLFNKLSSAGHFTQRLIIHNYSRSIELLKITNLYKNFPSQTNINSDKILKLKEAAIELRFQEAINKISNIEGEFSSKINTLKDHLLDNQAHLKRVQKQSWVLAGLILAINAYLISKFITKEDFNNMYIILAAIISGILTLVHLIVVYIEVPKVIKKIFKKNQ